MVADFGEWWNVDRVAATGAVLAAVVGVSAALFAWRQARHAKVSAEAAAEQAGAAREQARYMLQTLELEERRDLESRTPRLDIKYAPSRQRREAVLTLVGPESLAELDVYLVGTANGRPPSVVLEAGADHVQLGRTSVGRERRFGLERVRDAEATLLLECRCANEVGERWTVPLQLRVPGPAKIITA
jgi:hypothetical protein